MRMRRYAAMATAALAVVAGTLAPAQPAAARACAFVFSSGGQYTCTEPY